MGEGRGIYSVAMFQKEKHLLRQVLQLVEKVFSTSCRTFEHFKKVLKSQLIAHERQP